MKNGLHGNPAAAILSLESQTEPKDRAVELQKRQKVKIVEI